MILRFSWKYKILLQKVENSDTNFKTGEWIPEQKKGNVVQRAWLEQERNADFSVQSHHEELSSCCGLKVTSCPTLLSCRSKQSQSSACCWGSSAPPPPSLLDRPERRSVECRRRNMMEELDHHHTFCCLMLNLRAHAAVCVSNVLFTAEWSCVDTWSLPLILFFS